MSKHRELLVQKLFENMDAVKRGMSSHMQQLNRNCPVSRTQLELLFAIRHSQPVSFKHLAQQLYLTPGAVSQLAEGLEDNGLISRHADESDRRIQCLRVSKKGNRLLENIEKQRNSFLEVIVADLTDEELALWLRVQEKMLDYFKRTDITEQSKKETM